MGCLFVTLFIEALYANGLTQGGVDQPTIRSGNSLDLVFTSETDSVGD